MKISTIKWLKFIGLLSAFALLPVMLSTVNAKATDSKRLNQFFEQVFEEHLARSPIAQSYLGIKDDYDKWDDISEKNEAEDLKIAKKYLAKLKKDFDFDKLTNNEKLSYRLFEDMVNREIEGYRWRRHRYAVNQMEGMHSHVTSFLINIHRIDNESDAEAYIKRLNGVKKLFSQLSDNLRASEKLGVLPPKFVFPYALGDIHNIVSGKPFDDGDQDSPLLADFRKKVVLLKLDEKKEKSLLNQAEKALKNSVKPAYDQLAVLLKDQEAKATEVDGVWKLPDGSEYYEYRLRQSTTTNLTADEIHEYGLAEVVRIHAEMREIMKKVKFKGSLQEFFNFMRTDKQFYYPDTDEGRKAYLDQAIKYVEIMKGRLDEAFNTKPKADIIVKAVEPFREKSAGWAFYQSPAIDGSRPGMFYVNLYRMSDSPSYSAEALAYHEGIPGHHMQRAISQELTDVPEFRKHMVHYTAYSEGWGLYTELLPKEMGFYQDPYSDFGRLSMELWRAIRLVVDTGIHYKKWTRQQTIDYHVENSPNAPEQATQATERYIVTPGQATAYKIGMRKILELRELAKSKLGNEFDLGEYHDVVLTQGAVPLSILEENVHAWVKQKISSGKTMKM